MVRGSERMNNFLANLFTMLAGVAAGDKDTIELLELQQTMSYSQWAIGGYYDV